MDEYARRYGELAEKVWREEYVNNRPIIDYVPPEERTNVRVCGRM